jgi:formate hydrogenlyase transcriptional activator
LFPLAVFSDLFYRLNVLPLTIPPLRDRRSDIPQLVMFFLSRFSRKSAKRIDTVSQEAISLLVNYPWPGNIRELQNVIQRAVVLSPGPVLTLQRDLFPALGSGKPTTASAVAGASSPTEGRSSLEQPSAMLLSRQLQHLKRWSAGILWKFLIRPGGSSKVRGEPQRF